MEEEKEKIKEIVNYMENGKTKVTKKFPTYDGNIEHSSTSKIASPTKYNIPDERDMIENKDTEYEFKKETNSKKHNTKDSYNEANANKNDDIDQSDLRTRIEQDLPNYKEDDKYLKQGTHYYYSDSNKHDSKKDNVKKNILDQNQIRGEENDATESNSESVSTDLDQDADNTDLDKYSDPIDHENYFIDELFLEESNSNTKDFPNQILKNEDFEYDDRNKRNNLNNTEADSSENYDNSNKNTQNHNTQYNEIEKFEEISQVAEESGSRNEQNDIIEKPNSNKDDQEDAIFLANMPITQNPQMSVPIQMTEGILHVTYIPYSSSTEMSLSQNLEKSNGHIEKKIKTGGFLAGPAENNSNVSRPFLLIPHLCTVYFILFMLEFDR